MFNLERYLRRAERSARNHAASLIPEHIILLRLACTVMLLLAKYVSHGQGTLQRGAYLALQYRATNDLLAIRHLLGAGFEETARTVTRSYVDALDLALVCLADKAFALVYSGEDTDYDKFWNSHVAYGKLYPHLRRVMISAGIDEETVNEKIERRRRMKTILSAAVHVGHAGAFRSWGPPALGYPDMVSLEPHGAVSVHTANHAAAVIADTYEYCATVMRLMTMGKTEEVLNRPKARRELTAYSVHFFAFQAMVRDTELVDGDDIVADDYSDMKNKHDV